MILKKAMSMHWMVLLCLVLVGKNSLESWVVRLHWTDSGLDWTGLDQFHILALETLQSVPSYFQ